MTREEAKQLNDGLTELTGIKHYANIEEMFEAAFEEMEEKDSNGILIKTKKE